nr:helix-turn-helix domain-containing protein [Methanobacterium sp. SMA-27]
MPIKQATINALKILGLTDYESKAYLSLASLISATALEISEDSGVPLSRTYDVLKSLHKKDFLEIKRGKPLIYGVVPPQDVFEKSRVKIKDELDEAESEVVNIYESQISKSPAPIWLIYGSDKIIKKELEIIGRAKSTLHIAAGFMFHEEVEKLNDALTKSLKRGIQTRIIVAPYSITDGEKIDISEGIKELDCEKKTFQIPFIKVIIRDKKEMLLIFCKFKDESVISQTAIGVWNQYTEFVETIADLYNVVWVMNFFNKSNMDTFMED